MQSKASDQSSICYLELVSSAKGDYQRIRIISMYDKRFLTNQSMKQHENDANPEPLTESGYGGRSCYQANLPDNNRAPAELPVEGQNRFKAIPRRGSPGNERVKADDTSLAGLKLKTNKQNGNPGIMHLFPPVKSPGFHYCLGLTEFRRRTVSLETEHVKPELVMLYPNSSGKTPYGKIVGMLHEIAFTPPGRNVDMLPDKAFLPPGRNVDMLHGKAFKPQGRNVDMLPEKVFLPTGRNVFSFSNQVTQRIRKVISRLKTCSRWRKTMNLPQLVVSLKELKFLLLKTMNLPQLVISLEKHECPSETGNRIFETCKLKVCQS